MSSQREVLIRILALSVDRRRKESLYVVLLWLGITHTHTRLVQIRKCPPQSPGLIYRVCVTAFMEKPKLRTDLVQLRISRELHVSLLKKRA